MRLQIVDIADIKAGDTNGNMMPVLKSNIAHISDIDLVDSNPDIIHLFGHWDMRTLSKVKSISKRTIPVVFTSVGGLPSLVSVNQYTMSFVRQISNLVTVNHMCGPNESVLLTKISKNVKTKIIPNPVVSNIISIEDMIHEMTKLYQQVIISHDKQECDKISRTVASKCKSDDGISDICRKILYIKYLNNRGSVPQVKLDELSETMIKCQYDEDLMGTVLKSLDIYGYTSSLLSVLSKKSTLTEGFMPIEDTDDKTTANILNCITNYR